MGAFFFRLQSFLVTQLLLTDRNGNYLFPHRYLFQLHSYCVYFPPCNPLFRRGNVGSPSFFYLYFHGKFSHELYSLIPPVLIFTAKTRYVTDIIINHPYSIRIPLVGCKFYQSSFFSRTAALKNRIPIGCSSAHSNLNLLKYRVNLYLPHIFA